MKEDVLKRNGIMKMITLFFIKNVANRGEKTWKMYSNVCLVLYIIKRPMPLLYLEDGRCKKILYYYYYYYLYTLYPVLSSIGERIIHFPSSFPFCQSHQQLCTSLESGILRAAHSPFK